MQPSAIIFLLAVWAIIFGNIGFCFYRLLTSKRNLAEDDTTPN
jgi:hypothetical protein